MSQSMYLTIYFRNKYDEGKFSKDMQDARRIFRILWELEGTGFDKKGNIKGLAQLYRNMEYDSDAEDLEKENGDLSILKMHPPDIAENISFNFHNYGADLQITEKIELRDIYKLFAEILSSCFGYVVNLSDTYDEVKYMWFYDEDGKCYQMQEDRSDYLQAIRDMDNTERNIKIEKDTLERAKKILQKYNSHKPEVDSSQPLDVKQEGGNGVPPTPKVDGYPA